MERRQVKIKHVNEGLAVRASLSKVSKNKGTRNSIECNDLGKNASYESSLLL